MAAGDLVEYKGRHWKVLSENRGLRTLLLQNWEDSKEEVATDDPGLSKPLQVTQWPFIVSPVVPLKACRLDRLTRPVKGMELIPFKEWSPTALLQMGGPIFLSPSLRLLPGEVLILRYAGNGITSRIVIHPQFGSMALRQKRLEKAIKPPKTLYDFLDEDE